MCGSITSEEENLTLELEELLLEIEPNCEPRGDTYISVNSCYNFLKAFRMQISLNFDTIDAQQHVWLNELPIRE